MRVISLPTKHYLNRGQVVNGEWRELTSGGYLGYDFTWGATNVCFYGFYIETVLVEPYIGEDTGENFLYPCTLTIKDLSGTVTTNSLTPYKWNVLEIKNVDHATITAGSGSQYSRAECFDENDVPIPGRKYIRVTKFEAWYSQWGEGTDYIETINMISPADGIKTPLPHSIWRLEDGSITITRFPEAAAPLHEPISYSIWRLTPDERDYIFHRRLPNHLPSTLEGAFCHAEHLRKVKIPESVKRIGNQAFRYTALKRVKIASDCTYNAETSFPPDCTVKRYPNSNCGQLYDSSGKAVLDSQARRIYVKKKEVSGNG